MLRGSFVAALLVLGAHAWSADAPPAAAEVAVPAVAASPVAVPSAPVDQLVATFNPDLHGTGGKPTIPMTSTWTAPASDIASEVLDNFWFSFLVFLPFLILPQVLLLYAMLKFRDRGDGRPSATFMHNTKLENLWTAIPILALAIVAVPVYPLLYKMELPPENAEQALNITVRGKSFAWEYDYKREGVEVSQDLVSAQQEPVVLIKDVPVVLAITSNDVNHAWWVPAFGVKKDAIFGRYNNTWFTPKQTGAFKGQCAELCGEGHGVMIISAVVVERPEFDAWVALQRFRNPALKVWNAAIEWEQGEPDEALRKAVADYRTRVGAGGMADYALNYWMAYNTVSFGRAAPLRGASAEDQASFPQRFQDWVAQRDKMQMRRDRVGQLLTGGVAEAPADAPVVAAATVSEQE